VQRVRQCSVTVDGQIVGQIGRGLLVLLGVTHDDTQADVEYLAAKTAGLRIFEDDAGKMNRSVLDIGGQVLVVSQFTLWGDCRRGKRPSFTDAAAPELAEQLYQAYISAVQRLGVPTAAGKFRAHMDVALINDGPVTLWLDSRKAF
jgi:D-tyrosyl-tRNA(Tyr) deacylase